MFPADQIQCMRIGGKIKGIPGYMSQTANLGVGGQMFFKRNIFQLIGNQIEIYIHKQPPIHFV